MFCPKCGSRSEYGKFCRGCGTNLEVVSEAITGQAPGQLAGKSGSTGITLGLFSQAAISNDVREIAHHKAISVFGEVTVDLTAAQLPLGETKISTYSLFGSVDVLVLNDVGIRISGLTALSELKVRGEKAHNGFFDAGEFISDNYHEAPRRLHIEVASLFAGIKIRR
jgi:predicted membrane protein